MTRREYKYNDIRDVFEDSIFETKAKVSVFEVKAKAKGPQGQGQEFLMQVLTVKVLKAQARNTYLHFWLT